MSVFLRKLKLVTSQYPILRGMIAYSVIWPTASLVQQTIAGKRWDTYDYKRCISFSLYGSLFVAPTLYLWVRFSNHLWPATNYRSGLTKALVQQFTYGPMNMSCFFFFMPLLQGRSVDQAVEELQVKLPQTLKVAMCYWTVFQTITYSCIPERNRVPFVAAGSLLWTIFLATMNERKLVKLEKKKPVEEEPLEKS